MLFRCPSKQRAKRLLHRPLRGQAHAAGVFRSCFPAFCRCPQLPLRAGFASQPRRTHCAEQLAHSCQRLTAGDLAVGNEQAASSKASWLAVCSASCTKCDECSVCWQVFAEADTGVSQMSGPESDLDTVPPHVVARRVPDLHLKCVQPKGLHIESDAPAASQCRVACSANCAVCRGQMRVLLAETAEQQTLSQMKHDLFRSSITRLCFEPASMATGWHG